MGNNGHEEGIEGFEMGRGTCKGKNVILKPNRYIIHYIYIYVLYIILFGQNQNIW